MKGIKRNQALLLTGILGAAGVALGALGAHGLEEMLSRNERLDTWETAVLYHLVHAAVMLVLALHGKGSSFSWNCFLGGVLVFSGSLYILCLTQITWLGAITPIGGIFLIVGWLAAGFAGKNQEGSAGR